MSAITKILFVLFLTTGCVSQFSPKFPEGQGLERSVFPVYVMRAGDGGLQSSPTSTREVVVTPYAACAATYVAPHVLATIPIPFSKDPDGSPELTPTNIIVLDGTGPMIVEKANYDWRSGLVLLRTKEIGAAVSFRETKVAEGEKLEYIGYSFKPSRVPAFVATADWMNGDLVVTDPGGVGLGGGSLVRGMIDPLVKPCASPVFDSDRRLVGIVSWKHGNYVTLISSATIVEAIKNLDR